MSNVLWCNGSAAEGMTTELEQEEFFEEEIELDGCCARRHCKMSGCPVATTHKCLNCGLHAHGICVEEWKQLSLKGVNISISSLTKEGQTYLGEKHNVYDICLQCVEELR